MLPHLSAPTVLRLRAASPVLHWDAAVADAVWARAGAPRRLVAPPHHLTGWYAPDGHGPSWMYAPPVVVVDAARLQFALHSQTWIQSQTLEGPTWWPVEVFAGGPFRVRFDDDAVVVGRIDRVCAKHQSVADWTVVHEAGEAYMSAWDPEVHLRVSAHGALPQLELIEGPAATVDLMAFFAWCRARVPPPPGLDPRTEPSYAYVPPIAMRVFTPLRRRNLVRTAVSPAFLAPFPGALALLSGP